MGTGYTAAVESLLDLIAARSASAAERGALVRLPTRTTIVTDGGIPFVVHVTDLQQSKAAVGALQRSTSTNPFLPPEPDLTVADLPPDHVCLLNKFNVLDHHLLIVTRSFESQESLLTRSDLAALARCMAAVDGLGFYNAGAVAGASQPHKHLQLVPTPLGRGPAPTPLDEVISAVSTPGEIRTLDELSFVHALIPLDGRPISADRTDELWRHYRALCAAIGVVDESQPYNLLLTRRWMLAVPRSREHWRGVSVNSLGFAGSLLVRNNAELRALKAVGPLEILRYVAEDAV